VRTKDFILLPLAQSSCRKDDEKQRARLSVAGRDIIYNLCYEPEVVTRPSSSSA